ncbi:MAG: TetR/AcrR family transcriptional regulator [Actinobacteria bacterium]|nr:TetR/AcrR family transcriptional regulator [Actinomycetota bacterium]
MEQKDFKNRERLIDAALEEFSTHSYQEASLNSIIKKADVSKGSFYFHFKDKRSLYLHLFDEIAKLKVGFFQKYLSENPIDLQDQDFFELIKVSSEAGIKFALAHPAYYRLALNFYREKGNRIYDEVKDRFSSDFGSLTKPAIERSLKEGKFREGFDSDFIVRLINFLLLNFDTIFPYEKSGSMEEIMKIFDKYIDFIKYGIGTQKRGGKDND